MTKRKVTFEGSANAEDDGRPESKSRRFKENHSLDSDEEEEKKATETNDNNKDKSEDVLDDEDIEGQEDETIREDDGIKVTPFNLKDEMEEGHFDAQGNYIPDKQDNQITDDWLDSVDWNKLPTKPKTSKKGNDEDDDDDAPLPKVDPLDLKKKMVAIMKAGENVLRALRRLGGNKKPVSTADRWKKKKANAAEKPLTEKEKENKEMLLKLTGYADDLMSQGDFQIYEKTFEKLNFEIKEMESASGQFDNAEEEDDDDAMLEAAFKGESSEQGTSKVDNSAKAGGSGKEKSVESKVDISSEVMWFYKEKEDVPENELKGPFASTLMLKWQEAGKFGAAGVYCRKENQDGGNFFNSKRIDFDLYT